MKGAKIYDLDEDMVISRNGQSFPMSGHIMTSLWNTEESLETTSFPDQAHASPFMFALELSGRVFLV